jgi:hypothetical protein
MDLIKAIKLDPEFLDYLYDVLVTVIPSLPQSGTRETNIRKIEEMVKHMLTGSTWHLEKCDQDWLKIVQLAVKHMPEEVVPKK